jgi:tRNA 2-thiouridine synthesizing protein D
MNIGILLTEGPFQTQHWETASGIARAALKKGHQVEMFLFLDGVYNALSTQAMPEAEAQPVDSFREILDLGGKIVACGVCIAARGLEGGKNFIEGVEVGGLPQLSEIIDRCDRFVSF